MKNAKEKELLDNVKQVGFMNDKSGKFYAPESFTFPACFASALRKITGSENERRVAAHNREYVFDLDYHEAMAASGMAFGNLWPRNNLVTMSVNDFTQIAPRLEIFARTFAWFGFEMRYYAKQGTESEQNFFRELVVDSIMSGKPALSTNLIDNPECSIVTGYDQKGDTLIGWSHFQNEPGACDGFEETGQYRVDGWYGKIWELLLFGEKLKPQKDPYLLLEWALAMLEGRDLADDGFYCGIEAYGGWIAFLSRSKVFDSEEDELKMVLDMHSTYTGQLAESRAWADSFFTSIFRNMLPEYSDLIKKAAECSNNVHDLMWEVWGALGTGPGDISVWAKLKEKAVREKTISILDSARSQDMELIKVIREILSNRYGSDDRTLKKVS